MRRPTDAPRVLATVTDYTRFCGLPAPAHPLLTLFDLAQYKTLLLIMLCCEVINPAERNALVGIKPTVGLTSRAGY